VHILIAVQGQWGQRIADHLRASAPPGWQIAVWQGPTALPIIVDDPEEFVPDQLAPADLLVVLPESAGLTDLAPDLAQRCGAKAVLLGIDKRPWAPQGLVRQVQRRLEQRGIAYAAPVPFCALSPSSRQHPLVRAFAEHYGRPELECEVKDGQITSCRVLRETPCGNTRYVAQRLAGTPVDQAVEQAGLLHHYYPCWGSMGADPVQTAGDHAARPPRQGSTGAGAPDHSPLHIAATMAQKSVARALRTSETEGECT
jgi:thymidylate synthase